MISNSNELIFFLIATTSLILILAGFLTFLVVLYKKNQLTHVLTLRSLKAQYETNLIAAQFEIQEITLKHVAQEIHDNVNMALTVTKLHLHNLNILDERDAQKKIKDSLQLLSGSIDSLANLSRTLNTDFIKHQGLTRSLEAEIERLQNTGVFSIQTEFSGEPVALDAGKTVLVFRIIQEALNNTIKHAQAKSILIKLNYTQERVELAVIDDGKGFEYPLPVTRVRGSGLLNIKSRLHSLQGNLNIISSPGKGTSIHISIPCKSVVR